MSADINEIKAWLESGKRKKALYLIVGHDGFDMGDFPIYVMAHEDFWKKCPPKFGAKFASIGPSAHEVYDLSLDLEKQLDEDNAWHPPARV